MTVVGRVTPGRAAGRPLIGSMVLAARLASLLDPCLLLHWLSNLCARVDSRTHVRRQSGIDTHNGNDLSNFTDSLALPTVLRLSQVHRVETAHSRPIANLDPFPQRVR